MRKNAKITSARRFRKAMTKPELWLWLRLKSRTNDGLTFRNQHPLGAYILDFYCAKARLCVEVDGEAHARDHKIARDTARDAWLSHQGIQVYRIAAADLLADPDEAANSVIDMAIARLAAPAPPTA